jgi:hypothetical protein
VEASIQKKTIDFVCPDTASDSIRGLKNPNLSASSVQMNRTTQACDSGTDNQDGLFFHECKLIVKAGLKKR